MDRLIQAVQPRSDQWKQSFEVPLPCRINALALHHQALRPDSQLSIRQCVPVLRAPQQRVTLVHCSLKVAQFIEIRRFHVERTPVHEPSSLPRGAKHQISCVR